MQIKTHPPMKVLVATHRTTLATIHEHIGTVPRELYADAARQHLLVTGPNYWFYHGMDGKPETEFTLEIVIPISGVAENSAAFSYRELPGFKCLSTIHNGSWSKLGDTYGTLFQHISQNKLRAAGESREVYLNVDFSREENNLTEVQIGLV